MRIKYIDGLKGLGAIMVFFAHFQLVGLCGSPSILDSQWLSWIADGNLAVALFIMLSGYSAWLSVDKKIDSNDKISRLVINRYLRFTIPIGIIAILIGIMHFTGSFRYTTYAKELLDNKYMGYAFHPIDYKLFLKSIFLCCIGETGWNTPLWMLKYVFLCTYIALILRYAVNRLSFSRQMLLMSFAIVLFTYWNPYLYGVVVGALFCMIRLQYERIPFESIFGWAFLLAAIAIRIFYNGIPLLKDYATATCILLALFNLRFLRALFETRFFQYLGKISFSVYLIHWPIICSIGSFMTVQLWGANPLLRIVIVFILVTLALFVFSQLSVRFIEKSLSNRMTEYIFSFLNKKDVKTSKN